MYKSFLILFIVEAKILIMIGLHPKMITTLKQLLAALKNFYFDFTELQIKLKSKVLDQRLATRVSSNEFDIYNYA